MNIKPFDIYGKNVFSESVMKEKLPEEVFLTVKRAMDHGESLDPETADIVASVIKDWAISKGATHFCHWFQPMTEVTAEKHTAFVIPDKNGGAITDFGGKQLIRGESDASSFPSGGLRATFEARGYTVWDVSSPIFVRENGDMVSLYIPCAFCSQNGEILDKKTPLLRSIDALNKQALRVLRALGDKETVRVVPAMGAEQEYFLVPLELAEKRLDLKLCGRTLFGELSAKGQDDLEDHYYGSIKESVASFMNEINIELWKLGVCVNAQHNEVAPAQFEIAPFFASVNVSTDQNQLIMDTLKRVAERHGFMCLLHEKPFKGLNGSGKHNNYSLITNKGENLFSPGSAMSENDRFMLFVCAVIRAVDKYQGLLRSTVATAGNDHRLGGNEAPPAIISIFLGDVLTGAINDFINSKTGKRSKRKTLELSKTIQTLYLDTNDRNRTSPLAFTGNKFEFRMVGSAQSTSGPNFALNTMIAEVLSEFADELEASGDLQQTARDLAARTIRENGRIIFNGDNYSGEWVAEAEKRELLNLVSTPSALKELIAPEVQSLFAKHGVLSEVELKARYDILLERYIKAVVLEASTMKKMISRDIIPSVISYSGSLGSDITAIKKAGFEPSQAIKDTLQLMLDSVDSLTERVNRLSDMISEIKQIENNVEKADAVFGRLRPLMLQLRIESDKIEAVIDLDYWPIPTYTDLLFKYL